ncbi:HAMP domain-containing sensor histidine kinase [Terasakiella sp. SH-1]|uniref:sensor histidine kinase n=1 Tax=Terasakiella sp. SH-1 TaxID=2560057 RepID=UPI0010730E67|nr:HAMP domain-containing sensor histidine kinase [Terasakiella sp. SH-1]
MAQQTHRPHKLAFHDRLEVKFLGVFLPLVIIFSFIAILLVEGIEFQKSKNRHQAAIENVTAEIISLSGEYLWNLDRRRLETLFTNQLEQPFVTGLAMVDEDGVIFVKQGQLTLSPDITLIEEDIFFQTDASQEKIGKVQIYFSDSYLSKAFVTRLIQNLPIVIIISLSTILGAIYVSQHMIRKPLKQMVQAIQNTEHDQFPSPIMWQKKDEIAQVIHSFNDLMQRRQELHQENQKLSSELLEAQKMEAIGHLAGGIAHEINTPIQYISSNIYFMDDAQKQYVTFLNSLKEQLSTHKGNPDAKELVDWIEHKIQELDLDFITDELNGCLSETTEGVAIISDIVRAMKEFNHSGQKNKVSVDINGCLKRALTISSNEWKHIATVEENLHEGDCSVQGYHNEINQVLLNLIMNATHAIEDNGPERKGILKLTSQLTEHDCIISISDNGTGIPQEVQDKIFLPFFTTKDVGRGTGQGLALCYDMIVNKHKGKIYFETKEGQGTTFFIKLPIE